MTSRGWFLDCVGKKIMSVHATHVPEQPYQLTSLVVKLEGGRTITLRAGCGADLDAAILVEGDVE